MTWRGLMLLLSCWAGAEGARILAVAPVHAPSHIHIISAVTRALALRGHNVTFVGSVPVKDMPDNHKFVAMPNPFLKMPNLNETLASFFEKGMNPWLSPLFLWSMGQLMMEATMTNPDVLAVISGPDSQYDLVILETFFAQEAFVGLAHKLNAPVVTIHPGGSFLMINDLTGNPINPAWIPSSVLGYTDHMSLIERVVNAAFALESYVLYYAINLRKQQALLNQYFPDAPPLTELLRTKIALTLVNNHYTLSYLAPVAPNVLEIGGAHIRHEPKPLPKDLQAYMDGAEHGVVYFSMGSNLKVQFLSKEKANAILDALGSLKQKVLLKWDGPKPKVAPNIRIIDWAPQSDLLPHPNMRLFVSHGGLLSTQEAVFNGVPLVGIPVMADQHSNMQVAVLKGFCVQVDIKTITKEKFLGALLEVINEPKYRQAARRLSALFRARPQPPLDAAVHWVEHVLQHGGDHLRPAAVELSWYQLLLLDVALVLALPPLLLGVVCWALCCRRRRAAAAHSKTD